MASIIPWLSSVFSQMAFIFSWLAFTSSHMPLISTSWRSIIRSNFVAWRCNWSYTVFSSIIQSFQSHFWHQLSHVSDWRKNFYW
jgi:hypothetical protein